MKVNHGLFSSKNDEYETPPDVFRALDREFGFETDVCATPDNAKCPVFYTPEQDGLRREWRGVCWRNPPYGAGIGSWIAKAYVSSLHGATVVCLVPARTDTRWWHDFAMRGEIRFIQGRLRFGDAAGTGPLPSAVVIFRPRRYLRQERGVHYKP